MPDLVRGRSIDSTCSDGCLNARARAPVAERWRPAARCAFECTFRHGPQRWVVVHTVHDAVFKHAAHVRREPHATHVPVYRLMLVGATHAVAGLWRLLYFLEGRGARILKHHPASATKALSVRETTRLQGSAATEIAKNANAVEPVGQSVSPPKRVKCRPRRKSLC